jgi:uncharacterized protein YjbJ (UPF0337 family)
MEGEADDMETPQGPTGAWPAEVWLAGEEPKEAGQAEQARANVMDKLEDIKEKLGPKVEDVKETLGPKLEEARDKLGPQLEKAKGKFGQTVDRMREKLFPKK